MMLAGSWYICGESSFTWQPKHPQTIKSNPDINLQFLGCSLWCQFSSAWFRWGAGLWLLHYWVVYGQPFECAKDVQSIQGYAHLNAATRLPKWSSHGMVWKTDLGTCQIAVSKFRIIMSFKSIVEIWHGLWIVQDIWEDCACAMFWNVLFVVVNFSCCGEETQEMLQEKELLASHIQQLASKLSGK